jgi:hypothetical protein
MGLMGHMCGHSAASPHSAAPSFYVVQSYINTDDVMTLAVLFTRRIVLGGFAGQLSTPKT